MNHFVSVRGCPVRCNFRNKKLFRAGVRRFVKSLSLSGMSSTRIAVLEYRDGEWTYCYWSVLPRGVSGQITIAEGSQIFVEALFATEDDAVCLIEEELLPRLVKECNRFEKDPVFLL